MINFAANMSVVSSGIYVISMFTSAIMIGRLPIYFSLYNYILLPWEITHIFTKRSARVITWAMVGFYLLYNYYQVAIAYPSHRTGHRSGEPSSTKMISIFS